MGEALEQAKTRLGLGKSNPGGENTKVVSSLEEVLSKIDDLDARDALRARVREITANANLRALEAEEQLKKLGGANVGGDEKTKEEGLRIREEITATAMVLLERGVDPKIVGQYIMGSTPVTPITVAAGGTGGAPGLTIDDVIKIMGIATAGKGTDELKETLEKLTLKIEGLGSGNRQSMDPIAFAQQQAELTKTYYETLKSMGMITDQTSTIAGEPLDVVQEKNRHAEKMEEITVEREYKQKITDIASDIPEKIGQGMAGQFSEGEGGGNDGGGGLEFIICTEEGCGTKIYITPDTGSQITCPKCQTVYTRKQTVETAKE